MRKKISLLLTALFVTGAFAGCAKNSASAGNGGSIKVGLDYELSGPVATYGQSITSGIELAIEEINKNGGVLGKQIEEVKVDNKSENAEAANLATKLATKDKVVAILGPATSGNTKAAAPSAVNNKVPLISASATADDVTLNKGGNVLDYVFKTCFSDSFQGVIMGEFATGDLGKKNAAVLIDTGSDYSKGLAKSFKDSFTGKGGKIVTEEAYAAKQTDFKAVLTKIKGSNPDVLFIPGYYEEVGLIVKQARELGLNIPVLGGDGYDSPKLAELAGKEALAGVYYTNHYSSMDTTPEVVKFKDAFKAKYGKEADAFNALGYDLAYFVADGIKRAGAADPVKLKDALAATKDFKGITGTFSMDAKHNPVKAITILEMKNGQPTFLKKLAPQK